MQLALLLTAIEPTTAELDEREKLGPITRHLLDLFQGIPGTGQFNQCLTIESGASLDILVNASHYLQPNQTYGGITFS